MEGTFIVVATVMCLAAGGCSGTNDAGTANGGQAKGDDAMVRAERDVQREVLSLLDALHAAASRADGAAYFALYAPEAVFIGTDASERWTLAEFHAYTDPLFAKGKGWTYVPRGGAGARNVSVVPAENGAAPTVAWFDELLDNEKYGLCRGTGVARVVNGRWRVCQYHLTFPVPNEIAEDVTTRIKSMIAGAKRQTSKVRIAGKEFSLEVADDESEVFRGLSGRKSIAPDGGMIFVFPETEWRVFVMRDCAVPIDVLFLDDEGRVVGAHAMQPEAPRSAAERADDPAGNAAYEARLRGYPSSKPAAFAIEVRGGTIAALGVREGDRIAVQGLEERLHKD